MRKVCILMVCLLMAGSLAFAAGSQEQLDPSKPFKGVELNCLMEGHPTTEAIQQLLPEFEEETGIKVNIEVLPFEEMTAKAHLTLSAKSSEYDVYMDHWGQGVGWATNGQIEELTPFMNNEALSAPYFDKDDYVAPFFKDAQLNGGQYGLPVYGESTFFYFRKDILDKYGLSVPTTTEELWKACEVIQEKSNGEIYPITLRGMQGVHAVYVWCTFLWGFGGSWLDDSGKIAINTPEAIAATQYYADLLNNFGPPGYSNFGLDRK